jgi:DNA primase catalytic subunit
MEGDQSIIPELSLPPVPSDAVSMKEKLRVWYEKYFDVEGFCEFLSLVYSPAINMPSEVLPALTDSLRREADLICKAQANKPWKRELAFYWTDKDHVTLVRRFKSAVSPKDLRAQLVALIPERLEYGPVFTSSPGNTSLAFANVPQLAELKFDLDITDYERPCCGPDVKAVCRICWIQIRAAIRTIVLVMKKVFDVKYPWIVFSGLKGAHVVYSGYSLSSLNEVAREQVANLFVKDLSKALSDRSQQELLSECFAIWREEFDHMAAHINLRSCTEWIELMKSKYPHLAPVFNRDLPGSHGVSVTDKLTGTSVFNSSVGQKAIAFASGSVRRQGHSIWNHLSQAQTRNNSMLAVSSHIADPRLSHSATAISSDPGLIKKTKVESKEAAAPNGTLSDLIVTMFAPRIDEGVLIQIGHLIKAWDCIHPVSKKRCVRIPEEVLMSFNPETVPTLDMILDHPERYGFTKPETN